MEEKRIYILDDNISFRTCSLFDNPKMIRGDCTNFYTKEEHWKDYYYCNQEGIHFHCTKHPSIELEEEYGDFSVKLKCPKCNEIKFEGEKNELIRRCLRIINSEDLKDAKLIRVEDYYYPELKFKDVLDKTSDYFLSVDIKKDKDGKTIIILYIGHKGSKEKAQFFIKPEKLQLTTDHKDLDPAKIISKIEVVLKDRTLSQIYDI